MCSVLQIGMWKAAPAEVFTVSELIGALPFLGTIIACTPAHSAVLIMAPKFLTSETWSRMTSNGVSSDF